MRCLFYFPQQLKRSSLKWVTVTPTHKEPWRKAFVVAHKPRSLGDRGKKITGYTVSLRSTWATQTVSKLQRWTGKLYIPCFCWFIFLVLLAYHLVQFCTKSNISKSSWVWKTKAWADSVIGEDPVSGIFLAIPSHFGRTDKPLWNSFVVTICPITTFP